MNTSDFMKELEYLLQDIPDEEKADALEYYRDYLEEASDDAENAIQGFGSPERIAAIIRTDIAGHMENGGEFTERGYEDERFRDPNYQMVNRYDLPDVDEKANSRQNGNQTQNQRRTQQEQAPRSNNTIKIILLVMLAVVTSPVWLGVGTAALGVFAGLFGVLVALIVSVALLTVGFAIAGIVCGVVGIIYMITNPLGGLLSVGIGCVFVGLAFLGLIVTAQVCGRLIPWMFRGSVDLISGLFRGREAKR